MVHSVYTFITTFLIWSLSEGIFYTFMLCGVVSGEWCHWNNHVGKYVYPTDHVPDYASILVPNVDNTITSFLLETIAKQHKVNLLLF